MTDKKYDEALFEELDQIVTDFLLRHTAHHNAGQFLGDFLQSYVALRMAQLSMAQRATQGPNWTYLNKDTRAV